MKNTTDPTYRFRALDVKAPDQKRIAKVKDKSLFDFKLFDGFANMIFYPTTIKSIWSFLMTMAGKFFFIQWFQKFGWARYPVKHVDNLLDYNVPFREDKVDIYLDFVSNWIRPCSMLAKRYGIREGSKLCNEFMCYMTLLYKEAFKMYHWSFTTTVRPKTKNRKVKGIQNADPHFECVPSLHIAIILFTAKFYQMLFNREGFSKEETERWNAELYRQAIDIGESVLYVKQHSVNCIPAAVYMCTKIIPELVSVEDGTEFISHLFEKATDVKDRDQVVSYIQERYMEFVKQGKDAKSWEHPVEKWLDSYEPYLPEGAKDRTVWLRQIQKTRPLPQ